MLFFVKYKIYFCAIPEARTSSSWGRASKNTRLTIPKFFMTHYPTKHKKITKDKRIIKNDAFDHKFVFLLPMMMMSSVLENNTTILNEITENESNFSQNHNNTEANTTNRIEIIEEEKHEIETNNNNTCYAKIYKCWAHIISTHSFLLGVIIAILLAKVYPPLGAIYLYPQITATWIAVMFVFSKLCVFRFITITSASFTKRNIPKKI